MKNKNQANTSNLSSAAKSAAAPIPCVIADQDAHDRLQGMPDIVEAAADMIKTKAEFRMLTEVAFPVAALSDPMVRDQIKQADLVWAFDSRKNNHAVLIGGAGLLGYCVSRTLCRPFSMVGIRYDSMIDSVERLMETVNALQLEYAEEHYIIKRASDPYPLLSVPVRDISKPLVREKVVEAGMISVLNERNTREVKVMATKEAEKLMRSSRVAPPNVKMMGFTYDPYADSLQAFVAELDKIKGKNWRE